MKKSYPFLILCIGIVWAFTFSFAHAKPQSLKCQDSETAFIVGEVTDYKTGDDMYCEYHISQENITDDDMVFVSQWRKIDQLKAADSLTLVKYKTLDGKLIAQKLLAYTGRAYQPEVFQQDVRFDELRLAFKENNRWKVGFKKHDQADIKYELFSDADFILDAGFDKYVQENWTVLTENGRSVFSFLSIPHLKAIDLKVATQNCGKSQEATTCFNIEINNFLYRLFSGALNLKYNTSTKQLQVFEGVVNILDENKETKKAQIRYYYK